MFVLSDQLSLCAAGGWCHLVVAITMATAMHLNVGEAGPLGIQAGADTDQTDALHDTGKTPVRAFRKAVLPSGRLSDNSISIGP